jgi:crossover junction endodeoxyribonuclease RusA
MVFTLARPAAARNRAWPHTMPDLSKLIRSTEDALSPDPHQDWAGAWTDDARVVEYRRAAKVYPLADPEALDEPGVLITVTALTPQTPGDLDA